MSVVWTPGQPAVTAGRTDDADQPADGIGMDYQPTCVMVSGLDDEFDDDESGTRAEGGVGDMGSWGAPSTPQPDGVEPQRSVTPPPGYEPLPMPEVWEPDGVADPFDDVAEPAFVTPTPGPSDIGTAADGWHDPDTVQIRMLPTSVPTQPVAVQMTAPTQPVPTQSAARPHPSPAPQAGVRRLGHLPRSLTELRNLLKDRELHTPQEIAVAAVLELGYTAQSICRLFRVPAWRIETWVEAALEAASRPQRPPRLGTAGRPFDR